MNSSRHLILFRKAVCLQIDADKFPLWHLAAGAVQDGQFHVAGPLAKRCPAAVRAGEPMCRER